MRKVVGMGYRRWEEVVMGDIRWGKWLLWGIEDGEEIWGYKMGKVVVMGYRRWGGGSDG